MHTEILTLKVMLYTCKIQKYIYDPKCFLLEMFDSEVFINLFRFFISAWTIGIVFFLSGGRKWIMWFFSNLFYPLVINVLLPRKYNCKLNVCWATVYGIIFLVRKFDMPRLWSLNKYLISTPVYHILCCIQEKCLQISVEMICSNLTYALISGITRFIWWRSPSRSLALIELGVLLG